MLCCLGLLFVQHSSAGTLLKQLLSSSTQSQCRDKAVCFPSPRVLICVWVVQVNSSRDLAARGWVALLIIGPDSYYLLCPLLPLWRKELMEWIWKKCTGEQCNSNSSVIAFLGIQAERKGGLQTHIQILTLSIWWRAQLEVVLSRKAVPFSLGWQPYGRPSRSDCRKVWSSPVPVKDRMFFAFRFSGTWSWWLWWNNW